MGPQLEKFVRVLAAIAVSVLLLSSCGKEDHAPDIPYVYVNFSLDPNSTQYDRLNVVGGWETVVGGYNGIVIYRKTLYEFTAFERACPYDPTTEGAQVRVESSGITCYCPVCGSKYTLTEGTPFEGPSRYLLKQYTTVYDGTLLYVSN